MNYLSLKRTATRMLTNYGMPMTHVRRQAGEYDASTSSVPMLGDVTQAAVGIIISGMQKNRPGSEATTAATKVLMDAKNIATPPAPGDEMLINSVRYTIVTVDNIAPASVVLAWELGLTSGA